MPAVSVSFVAALIAGLLAGGAGVASATSLFSTNGLGETLSLASGRGRALGGVTAALDDPYRVSIENPAAMASLRRVSVSTLYLMERRTSENDAASETFTEGAFPFVTAAVPLPRGIVFGLGFLREQSLFVSPLERGRVETPAPYTLRFERDGDIFRVPIGLAVGIGSRVQIGWSYDFWFGTVEETRIVDFDATDMRDTRDRVLDDVDGGDMSAGFLVKPIPMVSIGLRYRGKVGLTGERKITTQDGVSVVEPVEYVMPASISGGATVALRQRVLLAVDARRDSWEGNEASAPAGGGFADATRLGGGVEILPANREGTFFERRAWRLGFHRAEWHVRDADGDRITEWFATGGTSFFLGGEAGVVDLVVEYGRRGNRDDNDLEESLLRVGLGFGGGEPWRKPERRGRRGSAQPPPDAY